MLPATSQSFTGSASRPLHPNSTPLFEVNVHPGSSLHSVGGEDGFNVGIDEGLVEGCELKLCDGLKEGTLDVVGPDDGTDVGVIE